jgi:hypothetical protein
VERVFGGEAVEVVRHSSDHAHVPGAPITLRTSIRATRRSFCAIISVEVEGEDTPRRGVTRLNRFN